MTAALLVAMPGNEATPADEADLHLEAHINDVVKKDLTDYTGALRAVFPLRITDPPTTPGLN